jgi:hypothetical protein
MAPVCLPAYLMQMSRQVSPCHVYNIAQLNAEHVCLQKTSPPKTEEPLYRVQPKPDGLKKYC